MTEKLMSWLVGDHQHTEQVVASTPAAAFQAAYGLPVEQVLTSTELGYEPEVETVVDDLDEGATWITLTFQRLTPVSDQLVVNVQQTEEEEGAAPRPSPCFSTRLSTFTVGDWTGVVEVKALDATDAFEQVFDVSPSEVKMSSDLDYEDEFDTPVSDLDWSKNWLTLTFVKVSPVSDALVVEVVKVEKEEEDEEVVPEQVVEKTACWCGEDVDGIPCLVSGHDDAGVSALLAEIDADEKILRQYGAPADLVVEDEHPDFQNGYKAGMLGRHYRGGMNSDWETGYSQGTADRLADARRVSSEVGASVKGEWHSPEWH